MRILLDKSIGDFTNARVETIGCIQRAQIAFAKIVMKRRGQRELRAAETVNSLPVITHRKQSCL